MQSSPRSRLKNATASCLVALLLMTSCGPAPQPAAPSSSLARVRRAAAGEPPPHAKVGELWCYDAARADEFIRWRAETDAACDDEVASKETELEVAKIREGTGAVDGISPWTVVVITVATLLAGFGGGVAVGLMNK